MKKILILILIQSLYIGCDVLNPPKKDNNAELAAALVALNASRATGASSCTSASTTAITNPGKVTTPSRTDYVVSGCSSSNLSSIGFSGENITAGMSGSSASSRILSNSDFFSGTDSDKSIEVTFVLNNSSSTLDIVTRASGTAASSFNGCTIRIAPSNITFLSAGGSSSPTTVAGNGSAITSAVGTSLTYCFDAHLESGGCHLIAWNKSCSSLTSAERGTYPRDAEPVVNSGGTRLGFILNGVTITNMKIGTKVGSAGRLLGLE